MSDTPKSFLYAKPGDLVAVVNHHWDRIVERKTKIAKVHKSGNFTIYLHDGKQSSLYRPNYDGTSARLCKNEGFRSQHLEPWTPEIEAEVAQRRVTRNLEHRKRDIAEAVQNLKGESLQLTTILALELALGLTPTLTEPAREVD